MKGRSTRIAVGTAMLALAAPADASSQRLLEEWRLRPSAGAEALVDGAAAVFWNPARINAAGRAEASVLDLRAPGVIGVDGLAVALAIALDARTTLGFGYEFMGVSGIERTTTSPDGGSEIDMAENRLAVAASHIVGPRMRVGALVQYTRLPAVSAQTSVVAIGAGFSFQPAPALPLQLAAMAVSEGDEIHWSAGAGFNSAQRWQEWVIGAEYGVSDGQLAPGATHRVAALAEWRQHVELTLGLASEPDGISRSVEPVVGAEVRIQRYRLGMVREQLPNDFGGAYSFRFSIAF
jgi:hypothetical protein